MCLVNIINLRMGKFEVGMLKDEQTHEHALLTFTLEMKQMIYCAIKRFATTPNYSKAQFDELYKDV